MWFGGRGLRSCRLIAFQCYVTCVSTFFDVSPMHCCGQLWHVVLVCACDPIFVFCEVGRKFVDCPQQCILEKYQRLK